MFLEYFKTYVELSVWLVRPQLVVAEVVSSGLSLLGEGDHVWWVLKVPVIVSPELARSTNASLHLIHNQEDIVLSSDFTQTAEERWAGVVVTTLGLNWLDDDGGWWGVVGGDDLLGLSQAASLLASVLFDVVLEWVLEGRE